MDYEAVRAGMQVAIPFNVHLGLEIIEIGEGTATVRLPDDPKLLNHVGSQHAGGLFTAAEAASGGAFVGAFAERMGEIVPLAKSASINYVALAKGPIDARATLGEPKDDLLSRLDADGKVLFTVTVELADGEGTKVAEVSVDWHVRKKG